MAKENYFTQMPTWAKGIIGTVITLVTIYGGFRLVKWLNKLSKADKSKGLLGETKGDINKKNVSFTDSELKAMADILFQAMVQTGTDETVVYNTISKLKTKDDWNALVLAFGVRNNEKEKTWWEEKFTGNLIEWLVDELDSDEWAKATSILQKLGINL